MRAMTQYFVSLYVYIPTLNCNNSINILIELNK